MSSTGKILRGISIVFVMSLLSSVAAYLTRILLARSLSPYEYGLFYAVFTFIIFLLFFRDLGCDAALTRFIPIYKVEQKFDEIKTAIYGTFAIQFFSSTILVITLYILAPFLAHNYFHDPQAQPILRILIFYILTSVLFIVSKPIFQSFQKMGTYSLFEFFKNLFVLLVSYLLLKLLYGIYAPVWAFFFVPIFLFVIFLYPLIKVFPFREHKLTNVKGVNKEILKFGFTVTFTDIGGKVIGYVDTLLLTPFVTLDQVGIYNVVLPSALLFLFGSRAVATVLFPLVAELSAKKEWDRISSLLSSVYRYGFVCAIPILFTLFVYAKDFILLFFSEKYVTGATTLQIILIGTLFYLIGFVSNNVLSALGKPKEVTKIVLSAAALNFLFNLILIPKFGIVGAGFATTFSYIYIFVLSTYTLKKAVPFTFSLSFLFKILCSTLVLIISLFSFKLAALFANFYVNFALTVVVSGVIYFFVCHLLHLFSFNELQTLWKEFRK